MGGTDAREETGSNDDKGDGGPKTDHVDIGTWLATDDTKGVAMDDNISRVGKENETWVA